MENTVARRGVVRLPDVVLLSELVSDERLFVVVFLTREHEMIVGNSRPSRVDRVAAGNLVERVDRERCRAVRSWQEVGIHADRGAGSEDGIFVDAVRPDD